MISLFMPWLLDYLEISTGLDSMAVSLNCLEFMQPMVETREARGCEDCVSCLAMRESEACLHHAVLHNAALALEKKYICILTSSMRHFAVAIAGSVQEKTSLEVDCFYENYGSKCIYGVSTAPNNQTETRNDKAKVQNHCSGPCHSFQQCTKFFPLLRTSRAILISSPSSPRPPK